MIEEKISCDQCGIQKKDANHWICLDDTPPGPLFAPWGDVTYRDYRKHLCGEKCASVLLSRAIADWQQKAMEAANGEA